jgi:serine/threonine-protein kinase
MPTPSGSDDRNLLFAVLAMQAGLVGRDDLLAAMNAWALDRSRPLGEFLTEQRALPAEDRDAVERLVERRLARHGQDAAECLAALPLTPHLIDTIDVLPGAEGLSARLRAARRDDPSGSAGTVAPARFRVLKPHAVGGLGEVSVALDEQLGREVALKQIRDQYADDADSRSRFLREAEVTGRLEHPGIVPVYGMDADEKGRPRYAMRFIRGESLKQAVQRFHDADGPRRDPSERALALRGLLRRFVDVCNAVAYAHSRGVIHRDIKPANVMLGEYGETLVVDWGLARRVRDREQDTTPHRPEDAQTDAGATQQGQFVGTPGYAAPEQARGEQDRVGFASDGFSLGATLYCILTGQPPFPGRISEALPLASVGKFRPARQVKAAVPRELEAVCARAMAARPEDRYPSARALADEVERWLAGEPVSAYREPLAARARRWARRNRTAVASGVVLLLTAVVGLSLGLFFVERERANTARQRDEAKANLERAEAAEEQANVNLAAARRAEEKAKENLARAEENLKFAKKAVDECFGLAKNHPLLQRENAREIKKLLLEKTQPYYKNFRAQRPDDRRLSAEQASYLDNAAYITQEIGSKREAVAAFAEVKRTYLRLLEDDPDDFACRFALAQTNHNLAMMHAQLGDREKERACSDEAEAGYRRLLAARPKDRACLLGLARVSLNRGDYWRQAGKLPEALKSTEGARDLLLGLLEGDPERVELRTGLANAWHNLGAMHRQMGKPKDALHCYQQARTLAEGLCEADPERGQFQALLATVHHSTGNVQIESGQLAEALESFQKALDLRLDLRKKLPAITEHREDLATAHLNLGEAQKQAGKRDDALRNLRAARDVHLGLVKDHPGVALYQFNLASTYNNLGMLLGDTGEREEALKTFHLARDLQAALRKAHPTAHDYAGGLARTLANLGNLHARTGNAAESLRCYEEAKGIYLELNKAQPRDAQTQEGLATVHSSLGIHHYLYGKASDGHECMEKARAAYAALLAVQPDHLDAKTRLAGTWLVEGAMQAQTGKTAEAFESLMRARDGLVKLNNAPRQVAVIQATLAGTFALLGADLYRKGKKAEATEC